MKLLFATHNQHKAQEIKDIFSASGLSIDVVSLLDLKDNQEIDESGETLVENALIKAREGYKRHRINCFSDDTGLEVEALGGQPGVYSSRYAGLECNPEKNIEKLLAELKDASNRNARFRTVIALTFDGEEYLFEGIVEGQIINERRGTDGFGYDPIFQPNGCEATFAEMSEIEKNMISHRGLAIEKLLNFLKNR